MELDECKAKAPLRFEVKTPEGAPNVMNTGAFGARLGPRDAYRFAKGEEIT